LNAVLVKLKSVLNVEDIVLAISIVRDPHVNRALVVLCHLLRHVKSILDTVARNPSLDLGETLTGSQSADEQVCHLEEDRDETAAHRKVIVFKGVPLWTGNDVSLSVDIHDNLV
jgi:hypothetical protein